MVTVKIYTYLIWGTIMYFRRRSHLVISESLPRSTISVKVLGGGAMLCRPSWLLLTLCISLLANSQQDSKIVLLEEKVARLEEGEIHEFTSCLSASGHIWSCKRFVLSAVKFWLLYLFDSIFCQITIMIAILFQSSSQIFCQKLPGLDFIKR